MTHGVIVFFFLFPFFFFLFSSWDTCVLQCDSQSHCLSFFGHDVHVLKCDHRSHYFLFFFGTIYSYSFFWKRSLFCIFFLFEIKSSKNERFLFLSSLDLADRLTSWIFQRFGNCSTFETRSVLGFFHRLVSAQVLYQWVKTAGLRLIGFLHYSKNSDGHCILKETLD